MVNRQSNELFSLIQVCSSWARHCTVTSLLPSGYPTQNLLSTCDKVMTFLAPSAERNPCHGRFPYAIRYLIREVVYSSDMV